MLEYIDIYCERLGPGLWAEPINAISNAAFFIAAILAFRLAHKKQILDIRTLALIILIIVIGTGSSLFHTFATKWAMLSDSIPILFYQIAFLVVYARDVLNFTKSRTILFTGSFLVVSALVYQLPHEWMNGSLGYGPALLFLMILAGIHHAKLEDKKSSQKLFLAAGIFIASLTFRTFDMHLCAVIEIGTHFMWHILNGVVLYLTTSAYIHARKNS